MKSIAKKWIGKGAGRGVITDETNSKRDGAGRGIQAKDRRKMQRREEVSIWLKRLDLVRAELRQVRYPRTAEEGLRQCAELSAASMALLREGVRKTLRAKGEDVVRMEARRLIARFSNIDERWNTARREGRVTPGGK